MSLLTSYNAVIPSSFSELGVLLGAGCYIAAQERSHGSVLAGAFAGSFFFLAHQLSASHVPYIAIVAITPRVLLLFVGRELVLVGDHEDIRR